MSRERQQKFDARSRNHLLLQAPIASYVIGPFGQELQVAALLECVSVVAVESIMSSTIATLIGVVAQCGPTAG